MNQEEQHHVALPKLMGQPAYARPSRPVLATPRPFDPDDLPLVAQMSEEELVVVSTLPASLSATEGSRGGVAVKERIRLQPKTFKLRALAGRLLGGDQ